MKHLLHCLALGLLLTACSKGSDPGPGSNSSAAPAPKTHTLSFCYTTTSLDKASLNLGSSVWLTVDKTPLMLGSVVDPPFYMSPWNQSMVSYSKTLTVTGSTLTIEARFDNVYGTAAQPRDKAGTVVSLPATARLMIVPVIDGTLYTDGMTLLAQPSSGSFPYDNGTNPSRVFKVDLTKI